ncbi:hypothetical protein CWE15_02550 [Aliidiomarina taiwanensis]|uniref:Type II secretion system protein GspC N-terminal domain-containing protein n=1 Tax=Aliidiomarina taiwanensis TaxID=946228 RepID=A0A432X9H4_9GAMM|nr:hypothetical protein [Aliidiomarina taiwanensis]RUO44073.1 hypothetical protein CWE15_02550 [Aliidiomarina taiwanensis]
MTHTLRLAAALLAISGLSACSVTVQDTVALHPFHEQPIQDPRPQLHFATPAHVDASQYKIYVNTLYVGTVADFKENSRPLRLLSGSHQVSIMHNAEPVLTKGVVLQDGSLQVLQIPRSGILVLADSEH